MVSTCQTSSESTCLHSGKTVFQWRHHHQTCSIILGCRNQTVKQFEVGLRHFSDLNDAELVECQEERLEGNIYTWHMQICYSKLQFLTEKTAYPFLFGGGYTEKKHPTSFGDSVFWMVGQKHWRILKNKQTRVFSCSMIQTYILLYLSRLLKMLFPLPGHKEDIHVGEGRDELPAHCRALCEHLWLWYLGSALKVFRHLPLLPKELSCFVHTET